MSASVIGGCKIFEDFLENPDPRLVGERFRRQGGHIDEVLLKHVAPFGITSS